MEGTPTQALQPEPVEGQTAAASTGPRQARPESAARPESTDWDRRMEQLTERLNPIITKFYHDFLLRPVEASGLAYWKQQYINSGGPELTIAGMISSPEFFQSAGGTNQSYIEQLYVRLLGRPSDPAGLDYWTNLLDSNNLGRADVVLYFQYSDENRRLLINQWHQLYLGRPATDSELDLYLTQMKSGVSQRQVQMTLIDTLEYRSSPPTPGPGSATRIV